MLGSNRLDVIRDESMQENDGVFRIEHSGCDRGGRNTCTDEYDLCATGSGFLSVIRCLLIVDASERAWITQSLASRRRGPFTVFEAARIKSAENRSGSNDTDPDFRQPHNDRPRPNKTVPNGVFENICRQKSHPPIAKRVAAMVN
jgi:hypothetical protein